MISKTIAYTRVSTERQTEGNGVDQQRASIMAWAMVTPATIDEWCDESESGMLLEREKIQGLLERARRGEFSRLVIDRVDRLGRDLIVFETLYRAFTAAGIEVVAVKEKLDNSPHGNFTRLIFAGLAQLQRAEWLGRMKTCKSNAVTRSGKFGGGIPYGYRSVGDGKLEVDPKTASLVRRVFELSAAGLGLKRIASELDSEGYRTLKGTRLTGVQVGRILARRAVYDGSAPIQHVALQPGVKPLQPELI